MPAFWATHSLKGFLGEQFRELGLHQTIFSDYIKGRRCRLAGEVSVPRCYSVPGKGEQMLPLPETRKKDGVDQDSHQGRLGRLHKNLHTEVSVDFCPALQVPKQEARHRQWVCGMLILSSRWVWLPPNFLSSSFVPEVLAGGFHMWLQPEVWLKKVVRWLSG